MGTTISHVVKHDFGQFNDRNASKAYCVKIYNHLHKELLLGDGDPTFDAPGVLDNKDTYMRIEIADYDMCLDLHSDFWDIESFDRYHQLVKNKQVRNKAFDVVRALGAKEALHTEDIFTWCGNEIFEYPGCNFTEWMNYINDEYENDIKEFTPSEYWRTDSKGLIDFEPIYHDIFADCFTEYEQLQNDIPDYRLLGITRVGDFFLRCEKAGEMFLIDKRTKHPFIDDPVSTYWTFDEHFVVIRDGKSALFNHKGVQLTPYVKGYFELTHSCTPTQRGGIDMCFSQRIIENKEAELRVTVEEEYYNLDSFFNKTT